MYRQAANGGPQNHFGLAALTTPEGASAEYLGAARPRAVILYSYNPAAPDPTVVCKSYRFCSGLCNARCIPTYGYRRVHAILKRQVLAANHKRVYRGMKVHGLLLDPPHQHW